MSLVSIIVPAYNEESNIEPFYLAILTVFKQIPDANFELIFVNDGSSDKTLETIKEFNKKDNRVKGLSFARNFGKEAALFAGLRAVTGDCAIILDADLQHPPAVIPEMYAKWKEGFLVVEGIKTDRGSESFAHKAFTKLFYSLISKAVGMDMKNSSDYKLLDKKVVDELTKLTERNTFFRALSYWVGFNKTTVYYNVQERQSGETKWSTTSLIKYAINNIVSFSYAPLKIISFIGIVFICAGLVLCIDALISYIIGTAADGFPTIVFLFLIGFGGVLLSLGIIGKYIEQIYDEVKGRPQYIVEERIE